MKLRVATEPEKSQRDLACYEAWGPPLTPEAWVERERRLRAHRWAQEVMTTWLLCDPGGKVLSSCESFRVTSSVQGRAGGSYGIASVYTEPALRGQGHATKMLTLLTEELRGRELHPQAMFLFSDVGAALYRRSGYQERPAFDWVVPSSPAPAPAGVRWIGEGDLGEVLPQVARPTDPVVIWPSEAQLDWHLERERIYAEALGMPRPRHVGARLGKSTVLWAGVPRAKELVVLLLAARSDRDAERLLQAAASTAHRAGLEKVTVWETPVMASLRSVGTRVPRKGALPMLAPLDPSAKAEGWLTIVRALWL